MQPTRRQLLGITGTIATGAVAGCVDLGLGSSSNAGTQTSFYLLYDLARQVEGDSADVDSVVPFGQHGHGWDGPTAGQQSDIYGADLFVYMAEGFQPWADDVVDTIESDGEDVQPVAAREGIELIPFGDHETAHDHEESSDHDGHSHGSDAGDDHEGGEGHDQEGETDHDHGEMDPHFWLDPRRTKHAVETIRDGYVAVDPDNEDEYHDRTESYLAQLDELHHEFENALADTQREAVLVAGHNAFGYLGSTYGFDVHAMTGISPDEGVSAAARREAEDLIQEHDIEHVLHPVLEPREHAEQLVADTSAEAVLDVTAISGVTDEWATEEVGYLELMREVNLPTLRTALGGQ